MWVDHAGCETSVTAVENSSGDWSSLRLTNMAVAAQFFLVKSFRTASNAELTKKLLRHVHFNPRQVETNKQTYSLNSYGEQQRILIFTAHVA